MAVDIAGGDDAALRELLDVVVVDVGGMGEEELSWCNLRRIRAEFDVDDRRDEL